MRPLAQHAGSINLLDLIAALVITSLLLGVVLPSYQGLSERQHQAAELNRLQGILQQGRTLATLTNQELTLCPAKNASQCQASRLSKHLLLVNQQGKALRFYPGTQSKIAFSQQELQLRPLPQRGAGGTLLPCTGFKQTQARGITLAITGRVRINDDPASSLVSHCPP